MSTEPVPDPVHVERVKLTATYVNGLAIAIFAVGGLAPAFTALNSTAPVTQPWILAASSLVCVIVSAVLHYGARRSLKGLSP